MMLSARGLGFVLDEVIVITFLGGTRIFLSFRFYRLVLVPPVCLSWGRRRIFPRTVWYLNLQRKYARVTFLWRIIYIIHTPSVLYVTHNFINISSAKLEMFTTKLCSHVIKLICKLHWKMLFTSVMWPTLSMPMLVSIWITWLLNIHTQTDSGNTAAFTFIYFLDPVLRLLSQPLLIPPPFYKNSSYGGCRSNLWVVIAG